MKRNPVSRRHFIQGGLAAGSLLAAPAIIRPRPAQARSKTLRILQWNHFVPAYDDWFNNTFIVEWGEKHDTEVIVDNVGMSSLVARAKAEVEVGRGHDLFMFLSPPSSFEEHVIDHAEIYQECESRFGKPLDVAVKSTFNPRTGKYFGFCDSYVPDPVNYRTDLWADIGRKPDTWDNIRTGAREIYAEYGIPAGIGIAPELDTNIALRSMLAAFGASIQNQHGEPVFNSKETVEAFKFMKALYQESMTPEVFTWDPSSNNRMMLAGKGSVSLNAISITRTGESQNIPIHQDIGIAPPAAGPKAQVGLYHLLDAHTIWKFAENIDGAKQFLVDLTGQSRKVFEASRFYNFPSFPDTVPDMGSLLEDDAAAVPSNKYAIFKNVTEWTANVGYPGHANAAEDELFNSWMLSDAIARAARGDESPEEAVSNAAKVVEATYAKWRERGMI